MGSERIVLSRRAGKLFLPIAAFALAASARAEDVVDLAPIKAAVVMVVASGTATSDHAPRAQQGTGFYISKDGYLVTSYHLRTNLGPVEEGTVRYQIHGRGSQGDYFVSAAPEWWSETHDLLVLYASVADRDVPILRRGTRDGIEPAKTVVYSAGYPEGYLLIVDEGKIKAFGVIDPIPVWPTNFTFKVGQSGSPICRADTSVFALAKGSDKDAPSNGFIAPVRPIPIQYWDNASR